VESHSDTRDMYREFLEYCGYRVTTAATVAEAAGEVSSADVIVVAATLERKNSGIALVRWIRLHESTARLPIVVISTWTRDSDVARARAAGCDLFLSKPCLPHDLARAIRWAFAWTKRGRPMIKASTPVARLTSVRAVPGLQLVFN
jgi:CheY-like chemotaxis protein